MYRTKPIIPFQNDIRTVHEAAVLGDLEKISAQEFRQPIYTSKDVNGVPAFHKVHHFSQGHNEKQFHSFRNFQAISNGHKKVAEHFMEKTDRAVLDVTDRHGRYALHYAAGMGDEDGGREMFEWLKSFGADEHKADEVRGEHGQVRGK